MASPSGGSSEALSERSWSIERVPAPCRQPGRMARSGALELVAERGAELVDVVTAPGEAGREGREARGAADGGRAVEVVEGLFSPPQPAIPAQELDAAADHVTDLGLGEAHRRRVAGADRPGAGAGVVHPRPGNAAGGIDERPRREQVAEPPAQRAEPFQRANLRDRGARDSGIGAERRPGLDALGARVVVGDVTFDTGDPGRRKLEIVAGLPADRRAVGVEARRRAVE